MKNTFEHTYYNSYKIYYMNRPELDLTIYALDVSDILQDASFFRGKIPNDRFEKMLKFRNDIDKKLLIGCDILFEYGLKNLFKNIRLPVIRRKNKNGKPYILGHEEIYFNMSHAGKFAVCAFADHPVGVDIEQIKPIDLSIAEHYFCKEEYVDIMKFDMGGQIKRFYQYWVLKESFTKAVGLGLSIPLDEFLFLKNKNARLLKVKHVLNKYSYLADQFSVFDDAYEMAICIQGA